MTDTKTIAKTLKTELKQKIKGFKFSVVSDDYGIGNAIRVTSFGLSDALKLEAKKIIKVFEGLEVDYICYTNEAA